MLTRAGAITIAWSPFARKGIRPNKPWQPLTALSTEAHVMAEFLNCSPRFTAAQDVALGRLLEFDRDAWATVDARSCEGVAPQAPEA